MEDSWALAAHLWPGSSVGCASGHCPEKLEQMAREISCGNPCRWHLSWSLNHLHHQKNSIVSSFNQFSTSFQLLSPKSQVSAPNLPPHRPLASARFHCQPPSKRSTKGLEDLALAMRLNVELCDASEPLEKLDYRLGSGGKSAWNERVGGTMNKIYMVILGLL